MIGKSNRYNIQILLKDLFERATERVDEPEKERDLPHGSLLK